MTGDSSSSPLSLDVRTDVGRVRTNNEDSFGHAWLADGSLFVIVADGMGGHEAGEVASGLAVRVLEEVVQRDPDADPRERLYNGLLEVNEAIVQEGKISGTKGMGTTAVAGIFRGATLYPAQIGDSRIYQIRRGHPMWRTTDHTRVQLLVDSGQIDDEEAREHPESSMLTRALGHSKMADGRPLVPDVFSEPLTLEPEDALVFCSDGLTDLVDDWEIAQMVAGCTPEEATKLLVETACKRGGHDNVTVACVVHGQRAGQYDESFVPPHLVVQEPVPEEAGVLEQKVPAPKKGRSLMLFAGVAGVMLVSGLLLLAVAGGLVALVYTNGAPTQSPVMEPAP